MSAAEDDTELRDLLLQNLENSGVLSRLKAQMRAAVFLAMEEQDRIENKAPLVNESLKNCLNTSHGRVVAALVLDFLQVFDLDFTRSVFEPEINTKQLESRDQLCKVLDLAPNPKSPVLLELVQRQHQDQTRDQGPSQKQFAWVRQRFDSYDKDDSGSINKDQVERVFIDLFPHVNRNVIKQFVLEELRDRAMNTKCEWGTVRLLYRSLFSFGSSVVQCAEDSEEPLSALLTLAKGDSGLKKKLDLDLKDQKDQKDKGDQKDQKDKGDQKDQKDKGDQKGQKHQKDQKDQKDQKGQRNQMDQMNMDPQRDLDLDDVDDDSFFDDPLPAPQKTYGCSTDSGPVLGLRRDKSLSDLSVLVPPSVEFRKPESPVQSLSLGPSSSSEPSRTGASKAKELKDSRPLSDRSGAHRLDEDVEYDDDFNSHRSSLSRSELSIGEEIEEVSIEGPESSHRFDEKTQDLSLSQISHNADYMEDVP
ncbi:centrosomal protein 43 isoform X2 [Eucyclogobius newberryi]|uniref:centrosomal protein 43 isoform X2 n=1 Tax=Eucyclogobius newberryi TaxID=166745 RepID=UPI003B5924DA